MDKGLKVDGESKIKFVDMIGVEREIRVVDRYKHLGGISEVSGGHMQELRLRFNGAARNMNPRLRKYVRDQNMTMKGRMTALQILGFWEGVASWGVVGAFWCCRGQVFACQCGEAFESCFRVRF